jgi:hypothetical protein
MKVYRQAFRIAAEIRKETAIAGLVCVEEPEKPFYQLIPENLFKHCGDYIRKIVREINGSYEKGYFSCCAVMIRRLIETCMIEAFEKKGMQARIKNGDDYLTAAQIKADLLKNPFGNLSRNSRQALQDEEILHLGDRCAHDRFFTARKPDIDRILPKVRDAVEYLVHQFT